VVKRLKLVLNKRKKPITDLKIKFL